MNKTTFLFLVILIEGYVVLACELLAIRQMIPFVGSGTEIISIIISAVLLPLAVGYHMGGRAFNRAYLRTRHLSKSHLSVRKLLLRNILASLIILTFGLSYVFIEIFFTFMNESGIHNRLMQTSLYSLIFLVAPIYLLGQTVPLVSNYFSRRKLSEITGKMLFFSTTGSFFGSVFSTIVLMSFIGVHNTVIITLGLLVVLCLLLVRRLYSIETAASLLAFFLIYACNNNTAMERFRIVSNNAYNMISVAELGQDYKDYRKVFMVNRSPSSVLGKDNQTISYVKYLEDMIMKYAPDGGRDILVVGAGGFTVGLHDVHNQYTYVDIDPDIRQVAEQHYLEAPLAKNKEFIAASAREFVHNHQEKQYDLILIDVYTNVYATPMECTTREFLLDVKKLLKKNGMLVLHTGTSPAFEDRFTVRYHNTFASVFPVYRQQVFGDYNPWPDGSKPPQINVVFYIYFNRDLPGEGGVYTDDKNTYSLDRN